MFRASSLLNVGQVLQSFNKLTRRIQEDVEHTWAVNADTIPLASGRLVAFEPSGLSHRIVRASGAALNPVPYAVGVTEDLVALGGRTRIRTGGRARVFVEAGEGAALATLGRPMYLNHIVGSSRGAATSTVPAVIGEYIVMVGKLLDSSLYSNANGGFVDIALGTCCGVDVVPGI